VVFHVNIMVERNTKIKKNRGEVMIILNIWEFAVNSFVLSISAILWMVAIFMFSMIISLAKDFLFRRNNV
jgi:hypothetical protein